MSNKIKLGFVGGGNDSLIGVLHKVAAVMFDRYDLIGGVFSSNKEVNVKTANDLGLDQSRIYNDFEEMIDAESKVDLSENQLLMVHPYTLFLSCLHLEFAISGQQ